jgi:hypothetical protein
MKCAESLDNVAKASVNLRGRIIAGLFGILNN